MNQIRWIDLAGVCLAFLASKLGYLIFTTTAARLNGADFLGEAVGALAAIQVLALVASAGLPLFFAREIPKTPLEKQLSFVNKTLRRASPFLILLLFLSLILGVLSVYFSGVYVSEQRWCAAIVQSVAIICFTFLTIIVGVFKGLRSPKTAVLLNPGLIFLVGVILMLTMDRVSDLVPPFRGPDYIAGSVLVTFCFATVLVLRRMLRPITMENRSVASKAKPRSINHLLLPLFFVGLFSLGAQQLVVFVGTLMMSPESVATLSIHLSLAALTVAAIPLFNSVFGPEIAVAHEQVKTDLVSTLIRRNRLLCLVVFAIGAAVVSLAAPVYFTEVLKNKVQLSWPLLIACLACFALKASTGGYGYALVMTGGDRKALAAAIARVVLFSLAALISFLFFEVSPTQIAFCFLVATLAETAMHWRLVRRMSSRRQDSSVLSTERLI